MYVLRLQDFRIHTFNFKFADKENKSATKSTIYAVLHHSFPARLELLFAFDYQPSHTPHASGAGATVRRFQRAEDWQQELDRLNVRGFRTLQCNDNFQLSLR